MTEIFIHGIQGEEFQEPLEPATPPLPQDPTFDDPAYVNNDKLDGIRQLFTHLNSSKPGNSLHLVILMDRSFGLGRKAFYLVQKKLLAEILKYHTMVHPDYVRVAVITFAKYATTVIDGISNNDHIVKCQLFEGDNLWEKVQYVNGEASLGTNVTAAFHEALHIFRNARSSAIRNIILMVTDGSFDNDLRYDKPRDMLIDRGVDIFTMGNGNWANRQHGNIKTLASRPDYYAMDIDWKKVIKNNAPLVGKCVVLIFMDFNLGSVPLKLVFLYTCTSCRSEYKVSQRQDPPMGCSCHDIILYRFLLCRSEAIQLHSWARCCTVLYYLGTQLHGNQSIQSCVCNEISATAYLFVQLHVII